MTKTSQVLVPDAQTLESAVMGYIAQGFTVQNRTPDSVVLFKKKEFSVLWAVIGLLVCLLPLLVYLIVYASQNDQLVEIRIGGAMPVASALPAGEAPATSAAADAPTWSEDGQYWWNGSEWRAASAELPPGTQRSDDGHYYWNGSEWKQIVGTDVASAAPVAAADDAVSPEGTRKTLTFEEEPETPSQSPDASDAPPATETSAEGDDTTERPTDD